MIPPRQRPQLLVVSIASLATLLACIWSGLAAWAAAKGILQVRTEVLGYRFAFLVVVACAVFFLRQRPKELTPLVRYILPFISLAFILAIWLLSDSIFAQWKMKLLSKQDWAQMTTDLTVLAKRYPTKSQDQSWSSDPRQLPRSFRLLGRSDEYAAGFGGEGFFGQTNPIACVLYGFKARTWGLFVGTSEEASWYWKKGPLIQVNSNAFFFFGPNY